MIAKISALAALTLLSACATAPAPSAAAPAPPPLQVVTPEPVYPPILLSDQFLAGPPDVKSLGQKWDLAQEGTKETPERIAQASLDQGKDQHPDAFEEFQPIFGAGFTAEKLPATATLFATIAKRIGTTTQPAKDKFGRARPFVTHPEFMRCTPALTEDGKKALGPNYSYPSGHSSQGYAYALVMTELMPDRAQELIERGFQYGRSRVICGMHWTSDTNAGRVLAGAIVAQLHGMTSFQTQLTAARAELHAAGYIH